MIRSGRHAECISKVLAVVAKCFSYVGGALIRLEKNDLMIIAEAKSHQYEETHRTVGA